MLCSVCCAVFYLLFLQDEFAKRPPLSCKSARRNVNPARPPPLPTTLTPETAEDFTHIRFRFSQFGALHLSWLFSVEKRCRLCAGTSYFCTSALIRGHCNTTSTIMSRRGSYGQIGQLFSKDTTAIFYNWYGGLSVIISFHILFQVSTHFDINTLAMFL